MAVSSASERAANPGQKPRGEPQPYDFRRPNKFSRDHVRALQIVSETFARQFSTVLATTLRTVSSVTFENIEQQTYDEFISTCANPTHLSVLTMAPLPGHALFQLPLPIAMTAIDRLLGGAGVGIEEQRAPTEIEDLLIQQLLERALRELSYAFDSLLEVEVGITRTEHNPQFAQVAAPSDMLLVIALDTRIAEEHGHAKIGLPYDTIAPVLEIIQSQLTFDRETDGLATFAQRLREEINAVPVDATVRFDSVVLGARDILEMQVGDVISLHHSVDRPLTLMVDGIPLFQAVTGRRGKRLACLVVGDQGGDS
ncbi:MAG: flagellar motor switch protein FliM [Acidimicrobiia bacterium]